MIVKSQLIEIIARKITALSEKGVAHGVTHLVDKISQALAQHRRVEIRGFGVFSLHRRQARIAHNPKTGEKLHVPEKYAIHFKPGKMMKERIQVKYQHPIDQEK